MRGRKNSPEIQLAREGFEICENVPAGACVSGSTGENGGGGVVRRSPPGREAGVGWGGDGERRRGHLGGVGRTSCWEILHVRGVNGPGLQFAESS